MICPKCVWWLTGGAILLLLCTYALAALIVDPHVAPLYPWGAGIGVVVVLYETLFAYSIIDDAFRNAMRHFLGEMSP